jgi:hypothetical protein
MVVDGSVGSGVTVCCGRDKIEAMVEGSIGELSTLL